MKLTERLSHYEKLMRLDKPIGILLLLWPTLWAQWLASHGQTDWLILWIFTMGVVLMRSAGCVINDYADRDIDPHVARTRERPLAAGKVSPREALLLAAGLALLAFLLVLPLGKLVIALSFVALFLAASYPFTKRFFAIPQAYLGIAFGFGIPMTYAALWGEVPLEAWLLLTANVFWAVAYDTEYAMVDRADDLKLGIKTSAITFGRYDLAAIALCYAGTLALLAWVGWQRQMGMAFYGGLLVAAAIALYHMKLIRHREPQRCFQAFLHNSWLGAAVFGGIVLNYLLPGL
ncbi:4-hydroxybenzoate octaprenyltransferase [Thiobacillus sp.]|uniref:4-hydroxybenzoate octaprenyltransferase n=1 Tax=Thiobacillus sp. TaxID=924 RepID=UPI0025E4D966|nr:4-hydroxybenzoate octaprenyltransferase [Thiobacillus sp.]MBT9539527.1 4-hydroxybenzoate octaprenyltransferase [Thiobacillus sp.]